MNNCRSSIANPYGTNTTLHSVYSFAVLYSVTRIFLGNCFDFKVNRVNSARSPAIKPLISAVDSSCMREGRPQHVVGEANAGHDICTVLLIRRLHGGSHK